MGIVCSLQGRICSDVEVAAQSALRCSAASALAPSALLAATTLRSLPGPLSKSAQRRQAGTSTHTLCWLDPREPYMLQTPALVRTASRQAGQCSAGRRHKCPTTTVSRHQLTVTRTTGPKRRLMFKRQFLLLLALPGGGNGGRPVGASVLGQSETPAQNAHSHPRLHGRPELTILMKPSHRGQRLQAALGEHSPHAEGVAARLERAPPLLWGQCVSTRPLNRPSEGACDHVAHKTTVLGVDRWVVVDKGR